MSEQMEVTRWNWQWTATFGVIISLSISGFLWSRGSQVIASVITIVATILAMYVIYKG